MIRELGEDGPDIFIRVRMNGLKLFPESLGTALEEGIDRDVIRRDLLEKDVRKFILSYFWGHRLVGIVGFFRQHREKYRHKGCVWGVYVECQITRDTVLR